MNVQRVLVAGVGFMGHGIAQVLAASGREVICYEPDLARAEAGRRRVAENLERLVTRGRLTAEEAAAILARLRATDEMAAAAEVDLVVEAVPEDPMVKGQVLSQLDRIAPPATIFATNTSSISIDRLAGSLSQARRRRFLGLHFFSPVPVMPLVEIVPGRETDPAVVEGARRLATELGKEVVVSADRPGFIVNRILMPFLAEAMRAYEEGVASKEAIDLAARRGLNHPLGPFELADFIGLDVVLGIMRVLAEELGGEYRRPPRVLAELVAAGRLGRKSGAGFYQYPPGGRSD
jgi:3-hydroxybutyryl-CoA dehydrogenase